MSLGGKPRKLDMEIVEEAAEKSRDAKSALKDVNTVDSSTVRKITQRTWRFSRLLLKLCFFLILQGDDYNVVEEPKERKRRHATVDANGNRILRVVKRDATEMAEVETTEKIIQVKHDFPKVVKLVSFMNYYSVTHSKLNTVAFVIEGLSDFPIIGESSNVLFF